MSSTKALAKAEATPMRIAEIMQIANHFVRSRFFKDATDMSKAVVKILAGRELGLGPFASMRGFYVTTQGRVEMAANLLASLVRQSADYDYDIKAHDNEKCEIEFVRKLPGGKTKSLGLSTFTVADAEKAGTQNVGKFPRNMLFARAISNGQKWFCPELTNGVAVYVEGEVEADSAGAPAEVITPEGEVVQVNAATQTPVAAVVDSPPAATPAPAADAFGPINDIQMGVLDHLERQLQPTAADLAKVLATFVREVNGRAVPVTDVQQLSASQADQLIARMEKAIAAKKGQAA